MRTELMRENESYAWDVIVLCPMVDLMRNSECWSAELKFFPKCTGTVVKTAGFVFSPRCFLHVAVAGLSPIHAGVAAHFRGIRRREASLRE